MKNIILFVAVLMSICITTQNTSAQSSNSTFIITFKVPSINKTYKVTEAQVVVNHEEQWVYFKNFKATIKANTSLQFDGKTTGNDMTWLKITDGVQLDNIKIKHMASGKSISLKGAKLISINKKGKKILSEITYSSAQ